MILRGDLRPVKIQQRPSGGCWRTLIESFSAYARALLGVLARHEIEPPDQPEELATFLQDRREE